MTAAPPSDEDVVACLEAGLTTRGDVGGVARIERTPYPYATSFPLEEVVATLHDGRTLRLILKDLSWDRLLGQAGRTKPRFLYEPRRCIDAYETILAPRGIGPMFYGALIDDERSRYCLLIEKVRGTELWQIGDLATWEHVSRWLARFHRTFSDDAPELARRSPHLLRYEPELFRLWPARALQVAEKRKVDAEQRRSLASLAGRYDTVVERLMACRPSLIHGELYPSNVLVDDQSLDGEVWPIDWEMAGVGPPLLDLAALTGGWPSPEQSKLVDAYLDELGHRGGADEEEFRVLLDCCRLHYAWQWLGWSAEWSPPAEHARDWVAEALELGAKLGL